MTKHTNTNTRADIERIIAALRAMDSKASVAVRIANGREIIAAYDNLTGTTQFEPARLFDYIYPDGTPEQLQLLKAFQGASPSIHENQEAINFVAATLILLFEANEENATAAEKVEAYNAEAAASVAAATTEPATATPDATA